MEKKIYKLSVETRPSEHSDMVDEKLSLDQLLKRCQKLGINIQDLPAIRNNRELIATRRKQLLVVLGSVLAVVFYCSRGIFYHEVEDCLISMPDQLSKAFRPAENCAFCSNVTAVVKLANLTPDEFERDFAYSGVPVIITDATVNWTAVEVCEYC